MYFQYPKNYYFPPKIEQINYHSKDGYRPELLNCEFSLLSVLTRDEKILIYSLFASVMRSL